jgi:hypothetical protein
LDNLDNNYPRRNWQYLIDHPDYGTEENSSEEEEDPERLFDEYINQASQSNENRSDFDSELPVQHSYLGETETVKGFTCYEENKIYEIPVIAHHSWVFPGEIVPMIMGQNRFLLRVTNEDEGLIFGLVFQKDHPDEKSTYGVTCQVYERGVDSRGHTILKGKSYQRFIVVVTDDGEIGTMRNQMYYAKVKILPERVLPEPIQLSMSNSLMKHNQNSRTSAKIKSFAAASTQWPSFVYNRFSSVRVTDKIESCMGMIKVEPPTDPIKRSFWYARNLPFNEEDRRQVFISNCVNERLLIIDERLETVS